MALACALGIVVAACGPQPVAAPREPAPTIVAAASPSPLPGATAVPTARPTLNAAPVASPTADPGPPVLQRLRVGATGGSGANMRVAPDSQAERVKLLPDGALVDLVDPGREVNGTLWRQVRDDTGATGWVAAELLAAVTAVEIRVSPLPIASGGPPLPTGAAGARVPPVDRQTCPESHPVKAVGVGGLRYYAPSHPQYAATLPDICFSSVEAAEGLGFRAP